MRKITSLRVRQILLTAAAGFLSLTANAQYKQTVEQYPNKGYTPVEATFKLTDVANTLGTDTTTLRTALQTWYERNTAEGATASGEAMFQAYVNDALAPTDASGYNGNFGGIWLGSDGTIQNHGSGAVWHAESSWDGATNQFTISLCQFPDSLKGGESLSKKFALTYGGKTATFDLTYNILTPAAVPEPTTVKRSELAEKMTKVGEAAITAKRTDAQDYTADILRVDMKGVAELLGIDKEAFPNMDFSKMIYTYWYDTELGVAKDSLTNTSTAGAPGFWYRPTKYAQGEEHQGEDSPYLGAAAYGGEDKVFLEQFKIVDDSLQCNLGQYPGVLKAGDNLIAPIYLIYGNKYYQINYNIICEEAPAKSLAEMTNVGNLDLKFEFSQLNGDYEVIYKDIDIEPIMTALGIDDKSKISFKVLKDEESFYPGSTDAGNYGYWLSAESYKTTWKDKDASPLFVTLNASDSPEKIGVGLFAALQSDAGKTFNSVVYYVVDDKYYTITINTSVITKEQAPHTEWEIVATKKIAKQVIAGSEYFVNNNQTSYSLTPAECEELIGTSSPALYCDLADSLKVDGKLYSPASVYLCTPAPGVWLGANGQGHAWTGDDNAPIGICWLQSDAYGLKAGDFAICNAPGNTKKAGDSYTATLYLVNEETNKMIKLDFNIAFVIELKSAETVGTQNVATYSAESDTPLEIDLNAAATALGVSVDDLVNDETGYFKVMTPSGIFTNTDVTPSAGVTFNENGDYSGADGDGTFGIQYIEGEDGEEGQFVVYQAKTPSTDAWDVTITFGFEVNDKMYVYNVRILDENTFTTGIKDINSDKTAKSGKIYNLQGMEVSAPVKGQIYIQNGKKFVK